jgi:hypothetical protein
MKENAMWRHAWVSGVFLATASLCVSAWAAAPRKQPKADPGREAAETVMRAELTGQVDRKARLADAIRELPDSPLVRWQAGFVRESDSWIAFDATSLTDSGNSLLADYESRRRDAQATFDSQLQLANWCRKQRLLDQERAHLFTALAVSPGRQDPAVLERLGYVQLGAQWLSREQLLDWQKLNQQAGQSLTKWQPRLEKIVRRLSGTAVQRQTALRELQKINEPLAVPAIEYVMTGRDEDVTQTALQTLGQIEGPGSSLALARQAVFAAWPGVRTGATSLLKNRKRDDFVPGLLSLLATPGQTGFRIYQDPSRGALSCTYAMAVETDGSMQLQVSTLHVVIPETVLTFQTAPGTRRPGLDLSNAMSRWGAQRQADKLVRDQIFAQAAAAEAFNDRIRDFNERVIAVLADIAGNDPVQDPRKWWQWWQSESDLQYLYDKDVVVYSDEVQAATAPVLTLRAVDCLAAGAPVRTDRGLKPIEEIRVGDRVLSQDVETGELAYKPVLLTTVRLPQQLRSMRLGNETFVTTQGHRFWDSGRGWVKVRDLEPQTLLHTVTGNAPVWSVKPGQTVQTYNLLVADFHTFFVGQTGLLSQDALVPRGTDNFLPGLSRANAVAEAKNSQ